MIRVNVVARFSDDKNSFFALLFVLYKLKEKGINSISILFIGDIISESLYRNTLLLASILSVRNMVDFTKKSIRFINMPVEIKQGYFLNFTIGNFTGFSGIESINNGFKTIFLNADNSLNDATVSSASQCRNTNDLIDLLENLTLDKPKWDKLIEAGNLAMKQRFMLSDTDRESLLGILAPA
ncbi:hypothetical protein FPZ43_17045 [Mucilaginibacter pallidiroseus]|uniref:Glycosyl transferase family 1 domain-containing protein n=1 Tax=Mucilaginibacter pallidiroseus TaxID=2599295 RepID=A0A563U2E8_9SPHI|nr:hypothetical protein [Mucilaginibacter pallidiroseus]TWR25179.1 hypothetical protein FPZ43_17045 [Mucilaginibacter pallidiroseus]